MKRCFVCNEYKEDRCFGNDKSSKDGKRSDCKSCRHKYYLKNKDQIIKKSKNRYNNNKQQALNSMKKYYENNKENKLKYQKKYADNNKETIKKYKEDYYLKNKDKIRAKRRKYYLENKENIIKKSVEYHRNRKENDADFALMCKLKTGIRSFILRGNGPLTKYVDYTPKQLVEHLDYFNNIGKQIDHIIPQSLYDFSNDEDIKKCWNIRNLRMISDKDNYKKSANFDMALIEKYSIFDLLPADFLQQH